MTLTDFLLARIAEDEAEATAATGRNWTSVVDTPDDDDHAGAIYADGDWDAWVANWDCGPANGIHIARHDPARVLAECEAKRRIVERHHDTAYEDDGTPSRYSETGWCEGCLANFVEEYRYRVDECPEKRDLAAVYSDHPDYRQEWKP